MLHNMSGENPYYTTCRGKTLITQHVGKDPILQSCTDVAKVLDGLSIPLVVWVEWVWFPCSELHVILNHGNPFQPLNHEHKIII
jgi:hypothetical protein